MVFRDHAMHGGHRGHGIALGGRLILQREDRIAGNVVAFERKDLLHGGDGDIDLLIVPCVVAPADLVYLSDDDEGGAVDRDGFAQQRVAGIKQLSDLLAQHGYTAVLMQVGVVYKAPLGHGNVTHHPAVGLDPAHVAGGVAPLAHFVKIRADQLGGNAAQLRQTAHRLLVAQR